MIRRLTGVSPAWLALIFTGAGIGTAVRSALEAAFAEPTGGWPWPTFWINVSGSLLLGGLLEWLALSGPDAGWRRALRLGAGTGLLGGYTTYSTFAVETVQLAAVPVVAAGYALGSVLAGVAAALAGGILLRRLVAGPGRTR